MHTHPGMGDYLEPSGMDKLFAELIGKPYYIVTDRGYKPYVPQYGGDIGKIIENIGPEIGDNASYWIGIYRNQIWK